MSHLKIMHYLMIQKVGLISFLFFFQIFHGMNYRGYSHSIIVILVIVKNNDECKSYNVKDDFLKMFYMKYIISKHSNRIKKL